MISMSDDTRTASVPYPSSAAPVLQQMRGERVAERMTRDPLRNPTGSRRLTHRPLQPLLMNVMPPLDPASRIDGQFLRRKQPLPCPLLPRVRALLLKRVRQPYTR